MRTTARNGDAARADADTTVRAARAHAFAAAGLPPDGGHSARWVPLRIGPVRFGFPNTDARRRAVRFHDLHHIATGYPTTWRGEFEISAWEIASGCGKYSVAWLLDFFGFAAGLFVAPRAVWRAFLRGRHSDNLYPRPWSDTWLDLTVGELQADLGLDREPPRASCSDRLAFAGWTAGVLLVIGAPLLLW